jgi:NAD(P) transhydrogenase
MRGRDTRVHVCSPARWLRRGVSTMREFDLVVLGGGPAGIAGAMTGALQGGRVALVEREHDIGGAGFNTGTVPSKTLRETALALSHVRARQLLGVNLSLQEHASMSDLTAAQEQVSRSAREHATAHLESAHVERVHGAGSFVDPHTVRVAGADASEVLQAAHVLIATGSSPFHPPEFPFEDERVHDSTELLEMRSLPARLAVVGAGVIGSEYACTFATLGVEVHLIDGRPSLLPFLDGEIAGVLREAMVAGGVTFHFNELVKRCDVSGGDVALDLSDGTTLHCDNVLVCSGRSSNTGDLNLAAAGVPPGRRGVIVVDEHFRTAVGHIYAAGDVIGSPALASSGMEQARVAMCHAFGATGKAGTSPFQPSGIYTIPEVGMVGETEESLRAAGVEYTVGRARYDRTPRGRLTGDEKGLIKLLFGRNDDRLLGVHVIGETATELVHIGLAAMLTGAGAELFNRACFNYPTLGDLYKLATYDMLLQRPPFAGGIDRG